MNDIGEYIKIDTDINRQIEKEQMKRFIHFLIEKKIFRQKIDKIFEEIVNNQTNKQLNKNQI